MAGSISIRLGLEGAVQLKQQLEDAGVTGGAAFDKLRSGLERLGAQDSGAVVQALQRVTQAAQQAQAAVGQAQANAAAGINLPIAGQSQGVDIATRSRQIADYGAQLDALRSKFNPLYAASKAYESTLDEIASAEKVGAISAAEAAAARDRVTASFAQSQAPIKASTAALKEVTTSSGAAAASMRGLSIQVIQGISGIATGQPILTTFIQQGHQVADQALAMGTGFGGIATAAKGMLAAIGGIPTLLGVGVAGAIVAVGVAANDNAARLADLRQALRLTHTDYGTLADAVEASAKRVASSSTLTKAAAEDIGKTIASSRYLDGFAQDLDTLTKSAADFARVAGIDGVAAGKLFRQAIDDPAAAAKAFADLGLPSLNAALLRTIQSLANSGQSAEATRLIFEAVGRGTKGATEDLTPLGRALHELQQQFYGAKDGGKSLADMLGGAVNDAAAAGVRSIVSVIDALEKLREKVKASGYDKQIDLDIANQYGNAGRLAAPASGTSSGGTISQVDSSIRTLLQDSAKQYQVDTELLARLQLVENRTPSGRDAAGNAIYPSSPTGAMGPMQVTGNTFRGMPEFAGQNIRDNATNIDAGTSLFATLLKKYGDPYMAVLAYHDGETLIDRMLRGDINPATNTSYQASIAGRQEAEKVTAGYTGRGYLGVLGGSPSPNDVGGIIPGGGKSSGGLPRSVQEALGSGSDGTQFANAQDAAASVEKYTKAIIDMHAAGQDSGPTMDRLQALLSKAREAAYGAVPVFEGLTRASQDQIAPLQAQTGAARTVAEAVNQATIALRSHGEDITSAQADQVRTDALTKLGAAFNDNVAGIDRQIAAQTAINQVYAQSGGNIAEITAKTQAEASARETAIPGTAEYARQVAVLTEKNLGLANSQKGLAQIQQNKGVQDNIDYIKAETATLGMNEDQRTRLLAVMRAEQAQHDKYGPILNAEQQHYVDLIGAQADYTASLKNQQAALSEVSGFFTNTFDTISSSITQAFATGQLQALKFKDIMSSVASAVIAEFAKLAVLNPLKNLLFGGNDQTLSSVGGALGSILGIAGGTKTVTGAAGVTGVSAVGQLASATAGAQTSQVGAVGSVVASGAENALGRLTGGSITSLNGLGSYIVGQVASALGNTATATNIALSGAGEGVAGVATASQVGAASVANAVGLSDATAGVISQAAGQVADALPYIGTAIALVTDIVQGNYRGAALVATGAALGAYVGTVIFPGIGTAVGTAIGATVGGLVDAFLPKHPLHPFENVELNVAGGQLVTGKSVGQLADVAGLVSSTQSYADSVNKYLKSVAVTITNPDMNLAGIGQGITGMNQTLDPNSAFNRLSFGNDPNDTSQFGVAKGALSGMSFASPQALADELQKIAGFADATATLGITLKAVGKDISAIQIASVSGANPGATSTVTDASGQQISYHGDLRTALNADLPTQTFADTAALDAEMQKVSDFVTGTLPGLLTPIKATQSTLQDQYNAIRRQYDGADQQSKAYGLDNSAVLQDGLNKALTILMEPASRAIYTTMTAIEGRFNTLGGYAGGGVQAATLNNLSATQANERASFEDQFRQTWGDAVVASDGYKAALQSLIQTQNAETQATKDQLELARAQSLASLTASEADIAKRAGIDSLAQQLAAYDTKAQVETDTFIASWRAYYGQYSAVGEDFQNQMSALWLAHNNERLQIEQDYNAQSSTQASAAMKQAQGSVASLFNSIKDYAVKLQTGSSSPLSPLSQYDLAKSQFNAVSGAALAGDANSASQLTSYADAFLAASQSVNDHGAAYAADFSSVIDALQGIGNSADALTQSFMAQQLQTQTDTLALAITGVQNEVSALRREVQINTARQAQAA